MASITTRAAKGTPLTHAEVDANFTNLNTDKLDVAGIALGTAASPTVKFTGDTNTGLYSPGADQLSVSTGGTERLRFDSTGQLEAVSLGTAAAPVYSFTTDPDTGLYSPGANQVALATGGIERARIDSNGCVGFGMTPDNQAYRLQIYNPSQDVAAISLGNTTSGSGALNGLVILQNQNDTQINNRENGFLSVATNNTERARIDSSGRLLVGTPSARSNFVGGSYSSLLQVERSGDSTRRLCASFTYGNTDAGAPFISFAKHRGGGIGEQTVVQSGDSLGSTLFHGSDGTNFILGAGISAEVDGTPGTNDMPGRLVFSTTADGASTPTERMRIDSTGLITIAGPGIKFPAAQVASADPNTLDDYEEGTWTPVISDGTNNATMDGQTRGRYTKIGNQVTIYVFAITSSLGSVTGATRISGLPFASASTNYGGVAAAYGQGLNITAGQAVTAYMSSSVSHVLLWLWDASTGTTPLQATEWGSSGGIIFSLSYVV